MDPHLLELRLYSHRGVLGLCKLSLFAVEARGQVTALCLGWTGRNYKQVEFSGSQRSTCVTRSPAKFYL